MIVYLYASNQASGPEKHHECCNEFGILVYLDLYSLVSPSGVKGNISDQAPNLGIKTGKQSGGSAAPLKIGDVGVSLPSGSASATMAPMAGDAPGKKNTSVSVPSKTEGGAPMNKDVAPMSGTMSPMSGGVSVGGATSVRISGGIGSVDVSSSTGTAASGKINTPPSSVSGNVSGSAAIAGSSIRPVSGSTSVGAMENSSAPSATLTKPYVSGRVAGSSIGSDESPSHSAPRSSRSGLVSNCIAAIEHRVATPSPASGVLSGGSVRIAGDVATAEVRRPSLATRSRQSDLLKFRRFIPCRVSAVSFS